jgi:hypothetical protein
MKQHIPAARRGRSQLTSYCGVPFDSPSSPVAIRQGVVVAAHGGHLDGYCRRCLSLALATAFHQMEYGSEGARMSQAGRSVEVRRELGRRAAEARWSRWRASKGVLAEPMRLGMASATEERHIVDVAGASPEAPGDDLVDVADRPLGDAGSSGV